MGESLPKSRATRKRSSDNKTRVSDRSFRFSQARLLHVRRQQLPRSLPFKLRVLTERAIDPST